MALPSFNIWPVVPAESVRSLPENSTHMVLGMRYRGCVVLDYEQRRQNFCHTTVRSKCIAFTLLFPHLLGVLQAYP